MFPGMRVCRVPRRGVRVAVLGLWLSLSLSLPSPARGAPAAPRRGGSLVDWLKHRDDLSPPARKAWEKELKKRFGGAVTKDDPAEAAANAAARVILGTALFMKVDAATAAQAAHEGYRGVAGGLPPPIAVHYQILALQGQKPRGRMIDLAFKFPDYYSEEIAPELVTYWEGALERGEIPDDALEETRAALEETRLRMRPLLLDKLRVLARLDRTLRVARPAEKAQIEKDMNDLEEELGRSFRRVARRPEVIDPRKRPYDRLRIQVEDMGLELGAEDRYLDPDGSPPPRREVPTRDAEAAVPASETSEGDEPLAEPTQPPPVPLPAQPRPGDPAPDEDVLGKRSFSELIDAYARRLELTIGPWIGTPYQWGASERAQGSDCSGFTRGVFREGFAIDLPRTSVDQARVGRSVPLNALRPGDLLFFDDRDQGKVTHVGIYRGHGMFAHASLRKGVTYDRIDDRRFRRACRGARRLLAFPE